MKNWNWRSIQEVSLPVVLYGAGYGGKDFYEKLITNEENIKNIHCFCDSSEKKIGDTIGSLEIKNFEMVMQELSDFIVIVTVTKETLQNEIYDDLIAKGINKQRIYKLTLLQYDVKWHRNLCADIHVNNMNEYFNVAEADAALNGFWSENSLFYKMFKTLDLHNVVELACGRGRHVNKYLNQADSITLVDILEKNIDLCKKRFENETKVKYYKNRGNDFSDLESGSYTALFTYDAMVHFESIDIYHYLLETNRILKTGGRALFHHSNNTTDYKQSFSNSIAHGRNYMSKQLFAHFADRTGFEVIEQHVIDWGVKDLDCITLVEKI